MAVSASADSDTCRCAAAAANMIFSPGVGRAVIVGAVDFEAPTFIARKPKLQQNADTPLSCHRLNNKLTTRLEPTSLPCPIRDCGPKTLHNFLGVNGKSFGVF
jgi:hypothetical protein